MKRERNRQKDKRRCKQTEGETKLKAVSTDRKTNEDAKKQKDIYDDENRENRYKDKQSRKQT